MSAAHQLDESDPIETPLKAPQIAWPVLESALAPLGEALSARFASAWGLACAVDRLPAASTRMHIAQASLHPHALVGTVRLAKGVEGALAIDPVAGFTILEFVLGNRDGAMLPVPERPFSVFEASVLRALARLACDVLAETIAGAGAMPVGFVGWQTGARDELDERAAACLTLSLAMCGRIGRIDFLLPLEGLAPLSRALDGLSAGKTTSDPGWSARLRSRVATAPVDLEAILHRQTMRLGAVRRLRVGDRLAFDAAADPEIVLKLNDIAVASGRLGHAGDRLAIRLEAPPSTRKETSA